MAPSTIPPPAGSLALSDLRDRVLIALIRFSSADYCQQRHGQLVSTLPRSGGKAVLHVLPDFRTAYPTIPWKTIAGMRSKLVHDYLDVDENVV
jgi:hypothetical protein